MVKKPPPEEDQVRPSCFCKISNCQTKARSFQPIQKQSTFEAPRHVDRADNTYVWTTVDTNGWGYGALCCLILSLLILFCLGFTFLTFFVAGGGQSSAFPDSSEDSHLKSQLRDSILWRKGNREHVGIWLGCYRRLCEKSFSERDYSPQFLDKIMSTIQTQFSTVVLNPPRPSLDIFPQGPTTNPYDLDNIRLPSLLAERTLNHSHLPISTILTFDNMTNFQSILYMANTANEIRNGSVTTLVFKGSRSLGDFSLLDDLDTALLILVSIRSKYLRLGGHMHQYKLGLLIDRNDCVKWEAGGDEGKLRQIMELVDVIMYRTQHHYYKYVAPRTDGNRRIPHAERQRRAADPWPYHLQMVKDLRNCERMLSWRRLWKEFEFLPVVNCDKYWWQTYINIIVREHKNLENLVRCWQLAGEWAENNDRNAILLMDREIEKHGWFSLAQ